MENLLHKNTRLRILQSRVKNRWVGEGGGRLKFQKLKPES